MTPRPLTATNTAQDLLILTQDPNSLPSHDSYSPMLFTDIRIRGFSAQPSLQNLQDLGRLKAVLGILNLAQLSPPWSLKIHVPLLIFATKYGRYLRKMDKRGIGSFVRASHGS